MKRFYLYLLLLTASIFCSCRNYTKEFNQLAIELENKGTLIDKNEKLHMLLYEENGCVKANDLDTSWVVFSPQNTFKTYTYIPEIGEKGMNIILKIENINIGKLNISYPKYSMDRLHKIKTNSKNQFSHFEFTIHNKENSDEILWYNYDSRNPNLIIPELPTTSLKKEFGEKDDYNNDYWSSISSDASFISDTLNSLFNSSGIEYENLSGNITIYFKTKNGMIDKISDVMKYINEDYDMRYKVETFKSIDDVSNFYYNINIEKREYEDRIKEIEKREYIEAQKLNYKKFEEIASDYSNNSVRADGFYKGRRLKVVCKLYKIEKNNNLFTYLKYKYKLTSGYYLFTEGALIEAYTNDENFVNLNYPSTIYMEATMNERNGSTCIFSDCKLMMTE